MPITIEKVSGGYLAQVTPPHGDGRVWASEHPQTAEALVVDLLKRGRHLTDIGDAFYEADPLWLRDT